MKPHIFTVEYPGLSDVLKSPAGVCKNGESFAPGNALKWTGIWDTGATHSLISQKVVDELALIPVNRAVMSTASGKVRTNVYLVDIVIPKGLIVKKLLVTQGFVPNADLLIGMDVIKQGDFAVSNFGGKTVFTYRAPSVGRIAF